MKSLKSSAPTVNPANEPQSPIIIPDPDLDQYFIEFEADFLHYGVFQMAKQALSKKDMLGASLQIKRLMGEIAG